MNTINPNLATSVSGAAGTAAAGNVGTPVTDQPMDTTARRKFQIDQRYIAPFLVTCVLLVGQLSARSFDNFYKTTALAIATSILTELILGRLFTGKTPHLASAYVSGISVGILMRSTETWPFVLCAAISIASKYVIRYKGRHLWNPSNLGIVAMLLLAPRFVSTLTIQWDNRLWAMIAIWSLGSFIIYRLKRFHICLTYALCFVGYAALRAAPGHDAAPFSARFLAEVAPITGPMYQLFIFFMITDPKTTVHSKRGQMLVAFLVASMENLLRMYGSYASPAPGSFGEIISSHAPYFALTLMGPSANLLEILRQRPKIKPAQN